MNRAETDAAGPRGKLMGVCASLATATGTPPLLVRMLAVIALLWAFKLTMIAYCAAAIILRLERR